jgi:thiol-disulfide isomerase/thioredoxin
MKCIAFMVYIFLSCCNLCAQTNSGIVMANSQIKQMEVAPGEKLPDVILKTMDHSFLRFSSLKGKLVIIDFWGIHCSSCIDHLPDLQRLQQQFGDKIQILVVTKDDSFGVKKLLSRIPLLRNISLPFITNDSVLSGYFYYSSLPTHVWIDSSGTVIQKTSGNNTTIENIAGILVGKKINLPPKKEFRYYQRGVPLFAEGAGRQIEHLQYYSVIMGSPEGLDGQSDILVDKDSATGNIQRIHIAQVPLQFLYQYAFYNVITDNHFLFQGGRVLLEVKDPGKFYWPDDKSFHDEWREKNLYSYEIKVPLAQSSQIYKWMLTDIDRYFGCTASIQQRKINCWVLKLTDGFKKPDMDGPAKWEKGADYICATNYPFSFFVDQLRESPQLLKTAVIDEVKGVSRINLNLQCTFDNISKLQSELLKNGFILVKEERLLPALVISDN